MKAHTVLPLLLVAATLTGPVRAAPAVSGRLPALPAAEFSNLECSSNVSPYTCSVAAAELAMAYGSPAPLHGALTDEELLTPLAKPVQAQHERPAPVPEPQTFVMMMLGLVMLGLASGRRERSEKFGD